MVYYLGNKVDVVQNSTRLLKNRNKLWRYGYDEDIDTVIISKDGTLGEVYNIYGVNIGLPEPPKDKSQIINHGLPNKIQKWKREELPKGLTEDNWFESRFEDYVSQQFKYRDEGYWIYLDGKLVYLTGTYWYFLQWCREESDYPKLRIIQNELMIFWEACKADKRSYGMFYGKNRRFGASALGYSELLESGTITENKTLGIISKKGKDAKKIFNRLVRSFKRLPPFFKPETDGNSTPKTELVLTEQNRKRRKGEHVTESAGLDTEISWHNTEINAMDGEKIFRSLVDECFGKGTKILMSDLSLKNVEDISVGDEVLVEGGRKIRVAKTFNGLDEMYRVSQPYSKDYVVNSKHRLYLEQRCKVKSIKDDGVKTMTPTEYLSLGNYKKRTTFGVRSLGIELPYQETIIDPYILGVWLGYGDKHNTSIAVNTSDTEIFNELKKFCIQNDFSYSIRDTHTDNCKVFSVKRSVKESSPNKRFFKNRFLENLKSLNVYKNKHIPLIYINNNRNVRLELLAGILDTDGSLIKNNNSCFYEFSSSLKDIADSVAFICRSLGFKVSERKRIIAGKYTSYSLTISGRIHEIPCRVERKKCPTDFKRQYAEHINKISIESIGLGEYFGIQLETDNDDDRRLILEDFTISMNCGKYLEMKFSEYWYIVKTSHRIGSNIVGKCFGCSTVNAMKKGGSEFKKIWNDSDASKRSENGQTKSGLYRLFIDAVYCLEGFFDEYGFSIVEDPKTPVKNDLGEYTKIGADTYLKNELEALKDDPEKYNEQLRQFPRSERDMLRDESSDCAFNLVKLTEQIDYNEEELDDTEMGNDMVERGNFVWKDGIQDGEAIWKPDPLNGRFWLRKDCHPPQEIRNIKVQRNKYGFLAFAPKNEDLGCLGIDPFNRSKTSDGRGSQGGIHLFTKMNVLGFPNNAFILEYIDRPPKIEMFYEDVILCMIYFSVPILPEMSSDKFSQFLVDRGYRHFVLNNPFKKWKDLSPEERRVGGVNAQNMSFREAQFQVVNTYIEDHIGVAREDSFRPIGEIGQMPFTRTLVQWKETDPDNRTDYDAYISSSLAMLGCQSRFRVTQEEKKPFKIPFRTFDNSGNVSVAI